MKKRIMSLLLVGILSCSLAVTPANAQNNMDSEIEALSQEYNLTDIDISEVPEGVGIIELSSVEEMEEFLEETEQETESLSFRNDSLLRKANTTTRTEYVLNTILAKTTMFANVTTNSKNQISSVSQMGVTFSGLTIGRDITNIIASKVISSDKKTATLYYDYTKNYYLLIKGLIKLSSSGYRAQYKYTVDKGVHSASHKTY